MSRVFFVFGFIGVLWFALSSVRVVDAADNDLLGILALRNERLTSGEMQSLPSLVSHGDRSKKQVSLTFDADMTPWMREELQSGQVKSYFDERIVDILDRTKTKATFFLAGMWIEMYPEVAQDLASNPLFELSNHSYSHGSFGGECFGLHQISEVDRMIEIEKTQRLLKDMAGVENRFFRFPGGCYSKESLGVVNKAGLVAVAWDVVSSDAFNGDREQIENNVLGRVQNGSIVVMHLMGSPNAPETADALLRIIEDLKARGFEFVTVSDLLEVSDDFFEKFDYRAYLH